MEDKKILSKEEKGHLIQAFKLGATIQEACLETGFDSDTVLTWIAEEDNAQKIEMWQLTPIWDAKKTMAEAIKTNPDLALKYLERKKKDEFSLRTEMTGKDGKDLLPQPILPL